MSPASSPNDPVFFLNHCNVDRIWGAWMQRHGRVCVPDATASKSLKGHRLNDELSSLISPSTTPAEVLDLSAQYVYDSLGRLKNVSMRSSKLPKPVENEAAEGMSAFAM